MGFQSSVALAQGFGAVGEIAFEGPTRVAPGVLKGTAANIVVGRAFTIDPSDGQYTPGGTYPYGGILVNPKALQSVGTSAGGPLAPTLVVPAGTIGEFARMGLFVVALLNACALNDKVMFSQSTGELSALPPVVTFTGEIAVTTGILTVSAASSGAHLGVGTIITGTGVPGGTVITALGTGTGGNGTYQTNITTAVASFTNGLADNAAPSGSTIISGAKVVRYANAAAGLAVVSLLD